MSGAGREGRCRGLSGDLWSYEEREKAFALRSQGLTCHQIGQRVGRSLRAVEGLMRRSGNRLPEEMRRTMNRRWTNEDLARLGELLPTGMTYAEMAHQIGLSKATAWRMAARLRGVDPSLASGDRLRRWSPEEKDLLVRLHARGWSPERIARRLHRTPGAVRAALGKRRKMIAQDPKLRTVAGVVEFCLSPMRVLQAAREAGIVPELTEADTSERLAALITQVRGGW